MAGSLNEVKLIGHLGADPEIRRTQDGKPIANLRIATSESWRDKNSGERQEKTEWHTVVIFSEGLAKVAESYARKGSKIYVCGKLQTRKWQDRDGNDRYSTEIILQGFKAELLLLDSRSGDDGERGRGDRRRDDRSDDRGGRRDDYDSRGGRSDNSRSSRSAEQSSRFSREMDDDIPF